MLEEHIPPFLKHLKELRYACISIQMSKVATTQFVIYLEGRVRDPQHITRGHLKGYLTILGKVFAHFRERPMPAGYEKRLQGALHLFIQYLHDQGLRTQIVLPHKQDFRAVPGHEQTLTAYETFLKDQRGLAPCTVETYLDHAARLCAWMVKSHAGDWNHVSPKALYDHLLQQARTLGHLSLHNAQTALRSFFRYLSLTGACTKDLAAYLVSYRTYSLSRVPKTVSLHNLEKLFQDVRGNSHRDLRDRAVLLLLTLYGLRIGEIVRLKMEDVDWREERLMIRHRKAGRDLALPLHPAVARALFEYVENARPRGTPYREVFLTRKRPGPYPDGSSLGMTLRERFQRLSLDIHPHALRHTLASRLINNNCPPEWIQILLGHQDFASTQIYAKVDLAHLSEVAQVEGIET